jgi:glycosyltransferase involved in cell wall biosynthesis
MTHLYDQLEILIPTYNRKPHITRTLGQLTAPDSPVHGCSITVLDNASTDGSSEVIAQFAAKYKNITHMRHPKNIGGNANIARAFELAKKPYVWVVCDDDSFRWDFWWEIENALQTGTYDLLLTRKDDLKGTSDIARIFRQCTFLPAGIYRTAIITGGVLMNMYNNVPNMFPHLALISEILNKKGKIFLPQGEIMDKCTFDTVTSGDGSNTRGSETYSPPFITNMFWTVGFINSIQMVQDKKLCTYILDHVGNHGFFGYIWSSFRKNYTHYGGYSLNTASVRSGLAWRQRMQFDLACMLLRMVTLFHRSTKK